MTHEHDKREPFLWQRCWDLHQQGLSTREIAFRLDLSDRTVQDRLRMAKFYARRQEAGEAAWERHARAMASVYDCPARQAWIRRQMEKWANKK